jgi:hypothetical protein
MKHAAKRLNVHFTADCMVMLGLEDVDIDGEKQFVFGRLTTEVCADTDAKWEERRQRWLSIYEKYKRPLSSVAENKDERDAARWQSTQRLQAQAYKTNGQRYSPMTEERYRHLDKDTKGWTWGGFDEIWERNLELWKNAVAKLGRTPSSLDHTELFKKAYGWQRYQRRQKDTLSDSRRSQLDGLEAWSWNEKEDDWILRFEQLKVLGGALGRVPTQSDDETLGRWCAKQREQYANKVIPVNRTKLLGSLTFWYWKDDNDAKWDVKFEAWKAFYESTGRLPDKRSSAPEERKAGQWQAQQRTKKKNLPQVRFDKLNTTLGWKWSEKDDTSSVSSAENTIQAPTVEAPVVEALAVEAPAVEAPAVEAPAVEAPAPVQPRRRKLPTPEAEPADKGTLIEQLRARRKAHLEILHQRYKSMNSATYAAYMTANTQAFHEYHTIAEQHDARDPVERQVMTRLAAECAKLPPKFHIADLGCGKNQLRTLAPHCKWTSVDAVAIDDTVQVADLGNLPFEDFQFHAAILSRALWGRDHMKQMQEAYRILAPGALLIVCESKRRWLSDDGTNQLLEDIISAGFHIKVGPEENDEVFQYIIAQKPALL